MFIKLKLRTFRKVISAFACISILLNSLAAPAFVLAQEAPPDPTPQATFEPTSSPAATEDPVVAPEPTTEETATPIPLDISPTPESTVEPTTAVTTVAPTPEATEMVEATPNENVQSQGPPTSDQPTPTPTVSATATPQTPVEHGNLTTTVVENIDLSTVTGLNTNVDSPTVTTDKPDYSPTSVVLITGTGFTANKTYTLVISSTDEPPVTFSESITADSQGNFLYNYQLDGNYRPNYKVEVKSGEVIVFSTTFTDSESLKLYTDNTHADEDYQFALGDTVYAQATGLNTDHGYEFDVKDLSGVIIPGTTTECFTGDLSQTSSYVTTAISNNNDWKFELREWNNNTCSEGSGSPTNKTFSVASATAYTDTSLLTTTTTYRTGETAYIVVNGINDSDNWSTTWVAADISCENTGGNDRPNSNSSERLPNTGGSYLQYPPATSGNDWNKISKYETASACNAFGSDNAGVWNLTLTKDDKHSVTLPVFTVIVDTTAPAVPDLVSPVDGAYVKSAGLILDWSDSSDISTPVTYYYQSSYGSAVGANNALVTTIYTSGALSASQIDASGTADGTYYWQARACDSLGNCSDWSGPLTLHVDNTAPTISDSIAPSSPDGSDGWYITSPVVSYSCTGATSCPSDFTFGEGTGTHTETVVDLAGNSASVTSGPLNVDYTAPSDPGTPTADVSSPTNQTLITWTWADAVDPVSGVKNYTWNLWQNLTNVLSGTTISTSQIVDTSLYGDGDFTFDTQASDNAGNTSGVVTSESITVDTVRPQVTSAETQDLNQDGNIDAIKLTFSENIDDSLLNIGEADGWDVADPAAGEGIDTGGSANELILSFGQGPTPDTGNTPTITYTATGGPLSTHDMAGNELASDSWPTTDKAAPVLIKAETKDTNTNGRIDQIIATFSENLDGESVDAGDFNVSGYTVTGASETSDGVVTINIAENSYNDVGSKPVVSINGGGDEIYDLAGNSAIGNITALDKAAPVSTFSSPSSNSIHNEAIYISGQSSDGSGDTVSSVALSYRAHGSEDEWTPLTPKTIPGEPFYWSLSWTPEDNGVYDIKAEATDDSGNSEQSPTVTNVTYDTIAPTGSWVAPVADSTVSGTVPLNFNATDNVSGVQSVTYQYKRNDGIDTFHNIAGTDWDTTGLPLDLYTLRAIVTDNAENSDNFDQTVGVSAVVSLESGISSIYGSTTITWTTSQPTSSRVVYDTVSHGTLEAEPNYGYALSTGTSDVSPHVLSHLIGISGLSNGTTYYYRTISAGSPTAIGDEHSFQTLTVAGAPAPSGTAGAVLGTSTQVPYNAWPVIAYVPTTSKPEEKVLGSETVATATLTASPSPTTEKVGLFKWILTHKKISLGVALGIIVIGYLLFRKKKL